MPDNTPTTSDFAKLYIDAGLRPIPLRARLKAPSAKGWPDRVFTPEEFPVGCNIGIGLEGLVDIDCDSRLTAIGARHILPATTARFGHHGVITHYMYRVANPPPFKDFGNVEFRTGHNRQTMVPGSKWYPKDGEFRDPENLRWAGQNGALPPPPEMAEVDGDKLYHLTQTLSALARMAECAGPGSFHRVNNAMAAYCVYRGIEVEVAVATITAMLEHTGSDLRGKERFIVDNYDRHARGIHLEVYNDALSDEVRSWVHSNAPAVGHVEVSFESVESSDESSDESSSDEPFAVHWLEASSQAKPPNWLVTNVLETGQIALLIAEENTGKTFCAMDLAMHIGAGARWMGNDVVRNPVLYVSGEGANGFRRRLAAIETHKPWLADADVQVRLEALTLTAKGEAGALVPGVDMRRMVKAVRASGAKFVVIDTLSANKGSADENSNDDIAYMLKQLRKRFDMAGVDSDMSILIVHHTTKDGQSWRGASALSNNTDVRFELRQAMRGEQDLGYKELTTPRQRDAVTAAMAFRLTPVVLMGEGMETFSSCIVTEVEQELRDEQDYAAQCRERWEVLSALPEYWDNPLNLRAFRPPGMLERECTNLLAKFVHKGFVQEVVDRGRKRYRCTELGTEKVVYYQRFAQT